MSQGYDVLPPRAGKAYPILCEEWDFLKNKIRTISNIPHVYHTFGSVLIGASLSTLISLLIGSVSTTNQPHAIVIAWAAVTVTVVCGSLALFFAAAQRKVQQTQASEIVAQMEIIEKRYEQRAL
jgi:hypothetical protein